MSEFTTELRNIVNSGINIFDFDYTLHDPAYKPTLEKKIIKHYYYREIGFETVGRFIDRLDTKLNEILPKYNIEYAAVAGGIDPFKQKTSSIIKEGTIVDDIDKTETMVVDDDILETTVLDDDTSESTVLDDDTSNSVTTVVDSDQTDAITNVQKFSDTPQGRTDLANTDYLTELTEENNNVTTALDSTTTSNVAGTQDTTTTVTAAKDSTTTLTGTKDTTTTTTGNEDQTRTVNETVATTESDRTQADLLDEFSRLYQDIDMKIIDELGVLFMGLY